MRTTYSSLMEYSMDNSGVEMELTVCADPRLSPLGASNYLDVIHGAPADQLLVACRLCDRFQQGGKLKGAGKKQPPRQKNRPATVSGQIEGLE